jgi:hypothetical protein
MIVMLSNFSKFITTCIFSSLQFKPCDTSEHQSEDIEYFDLRYASLDHATDGDN